MSKTDSVPSMITMMTKLYSTVKMHLFVLIQRFNNYLPSELDLGYNNKKIIRPKYKNKFTNYPLFVNVTSLPSFSTLKSYKIYNTLTNYSELTAYVEVEPLHIHPCPCHSIWCLGNSTLELEGWVRGTASFQRLLCTSVQYLSNSSSLAQFGWQEWRGYAYRSACCILCSIEIMTQ